MPVWKGGGSHRTSGLLSCPVLAPPTAISGSVSHFLFNPVSLCLLVFRSHLQARVQPVARELRRPGRMHVSPPPCTPPPPPPAPLERSGRRWRRQPRGGRAPPPPDGSCLIALRLNRENHTSGVEDSYKSLLEPTSTVLRFVSAGIGPNREGMTAIPVAACRESPFPPFICAAPRSDEGASPPPFLPPCWYF